MVVADPDRIDLAFANLIGNAVKYTPAGGRIAISGRPPRWCGALRYHRQRPRRAARAAPGDLRKSSSAARAQTTPGAGLGLFIAKEIVEAHGGKIGVEGERGEGSTFWIELPAAEE